MSTAIPIQSGTHVIGELPVDVIEMHAGHFNVRRNKRGHITRAFLKPRISLTITSNAGQAYRQQLQSGKVWALRSTECAKA